MKITLKLKPFSVPNYVITENPPMARQEGFQESPKFHLSDLDVQTLDDLCRQFRLDVFAKAKKRDPELDIPREVR